MPALNQFTRMLITLFRRFGQVFRRVAIHHHFARDQSHIQLLRGAEQRVDRLLMHGAEHQRGGGAVRQQLVQEERRHFCRVIGTVILALHREGILVEPLQQLFAKGADHLGLRIMNMGIDKAGHDQFTAQIGDARGINAPFRDLPAFKADHFAVTQR